MINAPFEKQNFYLPPLGRTWPPGGEDDGVLWNRGWRRQRLRTATSETSDGDVMGQMWTARRDLHRQTAEGVFSNSGRRTATLRDGARWV